MPFYRTLQACKAKFPASTKTDPSKSVPCQFCQETVQMKNLIKVAGLIEILKASKITCTGVFQKVVLLETSR